MEHVPHNMPTLNYVSLSLRRKNVLNIQPIKMVGTDTVHSRHTP
jgi:hypothetical protein